MLLGFPSEWNAQKFTNHSTTIGRTRYRWKQTDKPEKKIRSIMGSQFLCRCFFLPLDGSIGQFLFFDLELRPNFSIWSQTLVHHFLKSACIFCNDCERIFQKRASIIYPSGPRSILRRNGRKTCLGRSQSAIARRWKNFPSKIHSHKRKTIYYTGLNYSVLNIFPTQKFSSSDKYCPRNFRWWCLKKVFLPFSCKLVGKTSRNFLVKFFLDWFTIIPENFM